MMLRGHSIKTLLLAGLVAVQIGVHAEEPGNSTGEKKHEMPKLPDATERSFGLFSPLDTKAPPSFGSGTPVGPMLPMPSLPRVMPKPDDKAAERKDWIFAKPETDSADTIFKVKGISGVEKSKTLTPMQKFLLDDNSSSSPAANRRPLFDADATGNETYGSKSRSSSYLQQDDSVNNRAANVGVSKPTVFSDYFGGDFVSQSHWNEQAEARRSEFEQLFQSRNVAEAKTFNAPVQATSGSSYFNYSPQLSSTPDPYQNQLRQFGNQRLPDQLTGRPLNAASASVPSGSTSPGQPKYQPAVIPLPRRPGDLFSR